MLVSDRTFGWSLSQNRDWSEVRLSRKLFPFPSMRMSENTPSILPSPPHFWPLCDICWLRKLTICWRFALKYEKPAVKTAGETCQNGVLMATMRCARRHALEHQLQRCRQRVGLLINPRRHSSVGIPLRTKISKSVYIISNYRKKCQTSTKNIKARTYDSKLTEKYQKRTYNIKPTQKISKRVHIVSNSKTKYQTP